MRSRLARERDLVLDDDLECPLGIAVGDDGSVLVCERDTYALLRLDGTAIEVVATVREMPGDVAVRDGVIWFTGGVEGWPNGGFLYRLDDDGVEAVSDAPSKSGWLPLEPSTSR